MSTNLRMQGHAFKRAAWLMAIAALLTLGCLCSGCAPQQNLNAEEQEVTASQYMVNLNDRASQLSQRLQEFSAAVTEGKVSAMQAKAEEAYAVLDEMAALEAPDSVSDLKAQYNDAASKLKDALSGYIDLYTEVFDSSENAPFDYATYGERLEAVQKQYDEALNALEEADKTATEM